MTVWGELGAVKGWEGHHPRWREQWRLIPAVFNDFPKVYTVSDTCQS